MDVSAIICNEIIESFEEETNFNEKKQPVKHKTSIFCLHLLIAVSIYYYLIKYQAKQKHLLPFNFKNSELKQVIY